jgi:hypothetical protein
MKKRWVILLALGLLLGLAAAFWLGRAQREPEYEGKKLSEWAAISVSYSEPSRQRTETAIRQMGTNTLPWLLQWLDDEPPPPWKTKVLKIVAKFPARLGGGYAQKALYPPWARVDFARRGFYVLGRDARPAIPDLVRLAMNPKCRDGGRNAAYVLTHFGAEVVPELITILRSPLAPGRRPAIDYFGPTGAAAVGTNGSAVVEAIVPCLNDSDQYTRSHAALALGRLLLRPDVTVPALAKSCKDVTADVRESALIALALFGEAARPARPAIVRALRDSDVEVRAVAAVALEQIPE